MGERIDMIVVAYDISPADMLQFRDDTFSGLSLKSAVAIRMPPLSPGSIDTPAVFGLAGALSLIRQDDWLIVDADPESLSVNPTSIVMEQYRARQVAQARARKS